MRQFKGGKNHFIFLFFGKNHFKTNSDGTIGYPDAKD